jgi:putative PIN family toxin of toxin-antitoxin system
VSAVVLDTNVVVAAFTARGLCESVFELCLEKHELITSDFLLEELREKLIQKIKLPAAAVEEILELYGKNSRLVVPHEIEPSLCRDPNDLPVLGTCVSGQADTLISGDKDLLVLENIEKTTIVSPREFYELHR